MRCWTTTWAFVLWSTHFPPLAEMKCIVGYLVMPSPDWPRLMRTLWNKNCKYTSVKVGKRIDRLRTWSEDGELHIMRNAFQLFKNNIVLCVFALPSYLVNHV